MPALKQQRNAGHERSLQRRASDLLRLSLRTLLPHHRAERNARIRRTISDEKAPEQQRRRRVIPLPDAKARNSAHMFLRIAVLGPDAWVRSLLCETWRLGRGHRRCEADEHSLFLLLRGHGETQRRPWRVPVELQQGGADYGRAIFLQRSDWQQDRCELVLHAFSHWKRGVVRS